MNEVIVHIKQNEIFNKQAVKKFFAELRDGKYLVSAKNIRRRSNNQNRYLHGVVVPLVFKGLKDAGFDDVRNHDDAKIIIKDLFLRRTVYNSKTNTSIQVIRHTSELTTSEMLEFIDSVQRWASEYLNIYIPNPNEPMPMFAEHDHNLNVTIVK